MSTKEKELPWWRRRAYTPASLHYAIQEKKSRAVTLAFSHISRETQEKINRIQELTSHLEWPESALAVTKPEWKILLDWHRSLYIHGYYDNPFEKDVATNPPYVLFGSVRVICATDDLEELLESQDELDERNIIKPNAVFNEDLGDRRIEGVYSGYALSELRDARVPEQFDFAKPNPAAIIRLGGSSGPHEPTGLD